MTHTLFGVRIDEMSYRDVDTLLTTWMKGDVSHTIVTPNAEFLLEARTNQAFRELLNQSDLALADSVSLQYATAALSTKRLSSRYPGVDLFIHLCRLAEQFDKKVLLFGGENQSAQKAAQVLEKQFPNLNIRGVDPGFIPWEKDTLRITPSLVQQINKEKPTIVAVALGQYKQEQCIYQLRELCPSVKIWIGVGGTFDMISGKKPRAPKTFQTLGIEWLWRLCIEPSRWKRILRAIIIFPAMVFIQVIKNKTIIRSTRRVLKEIFSMKRL